MAYDYKCAAPALHVELDVEVFGSLKQNRSQLIILRRISSESINALVINLVPETIVGVTLCSLGRQDTIADVGTNMLCCANRRGRKRTVLRMRC